MTSGRQSRQCAAGVGARGMRVLGLTAVIVVSFLLLLIAGCGGSSSSSPSNGTDGRPTGGENDATVNGRVTDSTSGLPLAGVVVQYGVAPSVTTGASGTFSIRVGSRAGSLKLFVTGSGALTLYDYASVSGTAYRARTVGIPIPELAAKQVYEIGDIQVFTGDAPPPPPIF